VELDVRNGSVLRIARLVEELAGHCIRRAHFGATGSDIVSQLLEVILENIDDFVRLKLALNARRYTVDEDVEPFR